jgi:hypothetical protein
MGLGYSVLNGVAVSRESDTPDSSLISPTAFRKKSVADEARGIVTVQLRNSPVGTGPCSLGQSGIT